MYFYLCSKHFYLLLYQQEAISRRLSDATTEQSSNDDSSVDERPKPRKKIDSTSVKVKTIVPKIKLHDPKWTDGSILLDALSDKLSKIRRVSTMHSSLSGNYLHLLFLT